MWTILLFHQPNQAQKNFITYGCTVSVYRACLSKTLMPYIRLSRPSEAFMEQGANLVGLLLTSSWLWNSSWGPNCLFKLITRKTQKATFMVLLSQSLLVPGGFFFCECWKAFAKYLWVWQKHRGDLEWHTSCFHPLVFLCVKGHEGHICFLQTEVIIKWNIPGISSTTGMPFSPS